jgi:hypothetical protein
MSSSLVAAEVKNVTPPQVVLILGLSVILATTVIWLAAIGLDVVGIMSGLAPVLLLVAGAFGLAKVNDLKRDSTEIKQLSNGRLDELREDNKQLHERIARLSMLLAPPPPEEPK